MWTALGTTSPCPQACLHRVAQSVPITRSGLSHHQALGLLPVRPRAEASPRPVRLPSPPCPGLAAGLLASPSLGRRLTFLQLQSGTFSSSCRAPSVSLRPVALLAGTFPTSSPALSPLGPSDLTVARLCCTWLPGFRLAPPSTGNTWPSGKQEHLPDPHLRKAQRRPTLKEAASPGLGPDLQARAAPRL